MKTYKITINDEMFGEMSGEFKANTSQKAIEEAKDFYAMANDTTEDFVEIVNVEEL